MSVGSRADCGPLTQPLWHAAGEPLETNPQLHLLDWSACYIPATALDDSGGIGGGMSMVGAALLPDSAGLLAGNAGSGSSSSGGSSSSSGSVLGAEDDAMGEFWRVMRGMDLAQLRSMVGAPMPLPQQQMPLQQRPAAGVTVDDVESDSNADAVRDGDEDEAGAAAAAAAAEDDGTMMGVRRYEPEAGELVVLLSARVDGTPALGAELLVVVGGGGDGAVRLELPDGMEEQLAAMA